MALVEAACRVDDSLLDDIEAVIDKRKILAKDAAEEPLRRGIDIVWKVPHWLLKPVLARMTGTCSEDVFENIEGKVDTRKKLF
eukprot:7272989-Lingulodinium_polyedra.AAC.1